MYQYLIKERVTLKGCILPAGTPATPWVCTASAPTSALCSLQRTREYITTHVWAQDLQQTAQPTALPCSASCGSFWLYSENTNKPTQPQPHPTQRQSSEQIRSLLTLQILFLPRRQANGMTGNGAARHQRHLASNLSSNLRVPLTQLASLLKFTWGGLGFLLGKPKWDTNIYRISLLGGLKKKTEVPSAKPGTQERLERIFVPYAL